MIASHLERYWYSNSPVTWLLVPVSWLYRVVVGLRRLLYALRLLPVTRLPVPVIVVGNITVGGTGKTPLVIALADMLEKQGYRPGLVSRGYGGGAGKWPQQVRADSDPVAVGDEAVLLARRTGCPMAVGPKRAVAALALLRHNHCDVILSDDGLQHYALGRDIEVVVIDGVRRMGNGHLLPAGPLRESKRRIRRADLVVANGGGVHGELTMDIHLSLPHRLSDDSAADGWERFQNGEVHAVAGIGHPERFYASLAKMGVNPIRHSFPDHHPFGHDDVEFGDKVPVLMTEKDAVKCAWFAQPNHWYVPIEAELDPRFEQRLAQLLKNRGRRPSSP